MEMTIFIALNVFLVASTLGTGVPKRWKTWGVAMFCMAFWLMYAAGQIYFAPSAEELNGGQSTLTIAWPAITVVVINLVIVLLPSTRKTKSDQLTS